MIQAGLSAIPKLAQILASSYPSTNSMTPGGVAEQMGLVENPLLKGLLGDGEAILEVCERAEKELAIAE